MKKYEYKRLDITELYVNPENYRYINDADGEIDAIISLFNVTTGTPEKEMCNLAKDILEDGLNPFEMPLVCFDDDLNKYVVYDGNRRITCIKLMTQYKNNQEILSEVPSVADIYKLDYNDTEIQCVVCYNSDDAKQYLYKIHQDINDGIGRKQWDSYAKKKANAANGNRSKTYAIVEYLKSNPLTSKDLIKDMDSNRWISKLERVVGFAKFKETYNITFTSDNSMSCADTDEQVLLMLSKLVYDIIHNSATNNFRFKNDFENYVSKLDDNFKTKVPKKDEGSPKESTKNKEHTIENVSVHEDSSPNDVSNGEMAGSSSTQGKQIEIPAAGNPRSIPKRYLVDKAALRLGKEYNIDEYNCLNEKGKEMLVELESLNIKEYPFATAALCRAVIECILKLWIDAEGGATFQSMNLTGTYNGCINALRAKNIIDNREHSILKAPLKDEEYITLLNTWIHSDTSACVSETNLVSGWKNARLLIEKYIDTYKK